LKPAVAYTVADRDPASPNRTAASVLEHLQQHLEDMGRSVIEGFSEDLEVAKSGNWSELLKAVASAQQSKAPLLFEEFYPISRDLTALQIVKSSGLEIEALDIPELKSEHLDLLCSLLEADRRVRSRRIKRSLQAAKESGKQLGNPAQTQQRRESGMKNNKQALQRAHQSRRDLADDFAEGLRKTINQIIDQEFPTTVRELMDALNERGIPSRRGGEWSTSAVHRLLKRLDIRLSGDSELAEPVEKYGDDWGAWG
jgi:hypothetical protein